MAPAAGNWLWAVVFLHLGLSGILFSTATTEPFDYPRTLALQWAGLLLFAWMAGGVLASAGSAQAVGHLRSLRGDPMAGGVLLFVVSAVLSTVFSISPRTSLQGAMESYAGLPTLLAGAVLFFATRAACANWQQARWLVMAPVIAAAIAASYALVQAAGLDAFTWSRVAQLGTARPFGTMGNANALGSFLAAVWPLQVCLAIQAERRGERFFAGALAASSFLGALAVIRSASRAGWLGLAVGAVGVWLVLKISGDSRSARALLRLGLLGGILALGLALATPEGRDLLRLLPARVSSGAGIGSRAFLWRTALDLFMEHPLLGSGVDTFGLALSPRRTPEFWAMEWNTTFVRAHNEGLQLLATQGLLGAAAALLVAWGFGTATRRAWRAAGEDERLFLGSVVVGALSLLPQALVGILYTAPAILLVTLVAIVSVTAGRRDPEMAAGETRGLALSRALALAAPVVLLTNLSARQGGAPELLFTLAAFSAPLAGLLWIRTLMPKGEEPATRPFSSRARAAALVAAMLGGALLYPGLAADVATARGSRFAAVDPAASLRSQGRAAALEPGRAYYWQRLGQAEEAAARGEGGLSARERATRALERAVELEPLVGQYDMHLCRVAGSRAAAGEMAPAEAMARCDHALLKEPANPYFHTAAVNAAVLVGDLARGRELAERGLRLYPDLAALQYQVGFIALKQGKLDEAALRLAAAIQGNWHGQDAGREAARRALADVRRRQGAPPDLD
ncbi:MAG: O-antigen ligase family protein [Vicinamibacteria bacterium]|nr:O-antigen ligase family protein [Vicinamibacteria bacterium]